MKIAQESPVNMTAMLNDAATVLKASDETDTTQTGSTPPSSSDTTASSSSTLNDEHDPHTDYDDVILGQLARQLEYYFSYANLEKDTYLQTLRQLNDGCVPISILQRFSKVQSLTPIEAMDAIIKAVIGHSSFLEIVPIDTKSGKRSQENEDEISEGNSSTILAVGTKSGNALDNSILQSVVATPITPGSPVQNTIIIREVDSYISEADIRALFDDEHCPPIQSLYLDVFNCWFVTLDTTSRDDMLYAMMQLRSQYLGDEPVKARLKSLVRTVDPSSAPPLPGMSHVSSFNHLPTSIHGVSQQESGPGSANGGSNKGGKRKQKKRSKNANNRGNSNNANGQGKKNNSQQQQASNNQNQKRDDAAKKNQSPQPKPDLSAASFPALTSEDSRKVEVVVGDKMDATTPKAMGSDSASTTTTVSSSSSSEAKGKQQLGGYAAALLKAKPANPTPVKADAKSTKTSTQPNKEKTNTTKDDKKSGQVREKETSLASSSNKKDASSTAATKKTAAIAVKPPAWGGGRSFADVLAM